MFGLGTQELLVILVIALFLFGGKKLPEIGAGLGRGLRSFKKGLQEIDEVDPRKDLGEVPGVSELKDLQKIVRK
ncbi:twin-arginine translocase TatA/TatE family subunit [Dissulfurirhabdus thermomarina]|uniref:Sec-independent protein translocase protein TatA n=1 Tax=Dissulfurirhabdus thermomarina TaxID=1765737 RepID=A0A6N9TNZ8_DISTH|nr:twin-arginine translocase TatA/TatE family subunit [Dissulfurirhabdus thermomarina]NDY43001.1 twin-arginine translocase TatA/TatE family subunit [Dissulfurirhabdus thermomarina]NMX23653.1 twin-arginine translocase TatA/TatE family subunit [Dissulfurirhabdus thermomarina]